MSILSDKEHIQKLPDLEWFLVRTMPRSEQLAEGFFKSNNIPCYLPRYNRVYINTFTGKNGKSYSYKRPPVLSPMFPGYIFAALDASTMGYARKQRSIAQVCLHTNYTEDELVADLRKVRDFEYLAQKNKVEVAPEIEPGTPICIKRGPMKGWEGIVEKRINRNFVWICIKSVGYNLGIELAAVDCEAMT